MDTKQTYGRLYASTAELLSEKEPYITTLSSIAAFLYAALPSVNWVGFYFLHDAQLRLGPFMGKPACLRIPWGKGVCGAAALARQTQVVNDVHCFVGHIACDPDSRSEIVVPIMVNQHVYGVLDIDSPLVNRFTEEDQNGLERIVNAIEQYTVWSAFNFS